MDDEDVLELGSVSEETRGRVAGVDIEAGVLPYRLCGDPTPGHC